MDRLDDAHEKVSQDSQGTAILLARRLGIKSRNSLTASEYGVISRDGALATKYDAFHDMVGLRFSNSTAKL
jgi:hypothetical protein